MFDEGIIDNDMSGKKRFETSCKGTGHYRGAIAGVGNQ